MRTSSNHTVLTPQSRRCKKSSSRPFAKTRKSKRSSSIIIEQEEADLIILDSSLPSDEEPEQAELIPDQTEEGKDPLIKPLRRRQIDPTTCERDYSSAEIEFMNALDAYKRENGRMFPTCSEILEVFLSLGYVKKDQTEKSSVSEMSLKTIPAAAATPALSPDQDREGKEEPFSPYFNDAGSLPIF